MRHQHHQSVSFIIIGNARVASPEINKTRHETRPVRETPAAPAEPPPARHTTITQSPLTQRQHALFTLSVSGALYTAHRETQTQKHTHTTLF